VPEFDKTAFSLKTGQVAAPIHTQFGYHVIWAEKPIQQSKVTPFAQVKESIRQQLLQQKRNTALEAWLATLKAEYAKKISYAAGLAPPSTTTAPTTT
jgi:parvulin-like peptidyl-prolyl isomerase